VRKNPTPSIMFAGANGDQQPTPPWRGIQRGGRPRRRGRVVARSGGRICGKKGRTAGKVAHGEGLRDVAPPSTRASTDVTQDHGGGRARPAGGARRAMTMEGVKPTPMSRRAWTRPEPTARSGRGLGADPRVARASETGGVVLEGFQAGRRLAVDASRQSGSGTATVDKQGRRRGVVSHI
jgi:hypothetical protein